MGPDTHSKVDISRANGAPDSPSMKLLQQPHESLVRESEDIDPEGLRRALRRSIRGRVKLQAEVNELEAEKRILRSRLAAQEKELDRLDICLAEQEERNNEFSGSRRIINVPTNDRFQMATEISSQALLIHKLQREKAELQRSFESFALSETSQRSEMALTAKAIRDENKLIKEQLQSLSQENEKLRELGESIHINEHEPIEKNTELSQMIKGHKSLEGQESVLFESLKQTRKLTGERLVLLKERETNIAMLEDQNRKLEEEKCAWEAKSKTHDTRKGDEGYAAVEADTSLLHSIITDFREKNTKQLTTINSLRMMIHQLQEKKAKLCVAAATGNDGDSQELFVELKAKLEVMEREKQACEKKYAAFETTTLDRPERIGRGGAESSSRVQELQAEINDLRSDIKAAREDRDWCRNEYILLRNAQKVGKTSRQGSFSGLENLGQLETELTTLKRRVARALTEFDLSLGPDGIWGCHHDNGFTSISASARFAKPAGSARNQARAILILPLKQDEVFFSEYRKQRAFHVEHARAHDEASHGTITRSSLLEELFKYLNGPLPVCLRG